MANPAIIALLAAALLVPGCADERTYMILELPRPDAHTPGVIITTSQYMVDMNAGNPDAHKANLLLLVEDLDHFTIREGLILMHMSQSWAERYQRKFMVVSNTQAGRE